jgi:hypothetical protein
VRPLPDRLGGGRGIHLAEAEAAIGRRLVEAAGQDHHRQGRGLVVDHRPPAGRHDLCRKSQARGSGQANGPYQRSLQSDVALQPAA